MKTERSRFHLPWGLALVLLAYAGAVYGYIRVEYYDSPAYQASLKYARAVALLGEDDGRSCTEAELNRAFELIIEASTLLPDELELVKHLEKLRNRFEDRKFTLNPEWVKQVEMLSSRTMRIEVEKRPWLLIGSRDKGWAPEQLLAGPERTVLWSLPGAAFIILFWVYTRFSAKAARARDRVEKMEASEQELAALGEFRRGMPSARPAPKVEDDADTTRSPPPKHDPSPIVRRTGAKPAQLTSPSRKPPSDE